MKSYIEFVGAVAVGRYDLDDCELSSIGEFTRENVVRWFNSHLGTDRLNDENLAGPVGLEPTTTALTVRRSAIELQAKK